MTPCCPTCGQPVADAATLLVSPTGASVTRLGAGAVLTLGQAAVLEILRKKFPAHAAHEALILGMYGHQEPDWSENVLKIHVHHLRRKLAPLGVEIKTVWGVGYRLAFHDAPVARRAA
jgi:DNA-binding response OmpR family regulator